MTVVICRATRDCLAFFWYPCKERCNNCLDDCDRKMNPWKDPSYSHVWSQLNQKLNHTHHSSPLISSFFYWNTYVSKVRLFFYIFRFGFQFPIAITFIKSPSFSFILSPNSCDFSIIFWIMLKKKKNLQIAKTKVNNFA